MPPRGTAVILGPDLVALLQEMGLTWDEVRIYQFLLNASSAISSAIVRETGHSRGRIYESLRRLVEKGLVREEPTRPIQFHPTPLAEILAGAHVRLTRQLAAIEDGQAAALKTAQPELALPLLRPTRPGDIRVFSGRRACHAEWTRMLDAATRFFWLTGGGNLATRLARMATFLQGLQQAQERGVSVQLVLPKTPSTEPALQAMVQRLGPHILHVAPVDQFGPLVSCATEQAALESIAQPDDGSINRGDDVGMQVSSELFADATKRRLILAESFVDAKGPPPIYQWLGPNHGSDIFLQAVTTATKQVLVLGSDEWSTYLAVGWTKTAHLYEEAKRRGVEFRALTSDVDDKPKRLYPFTKVWDIRVADGHPVWLTLVDGQELYQAFSHSSLGGPPQFRHSREPNEVRFYATVFERLWAEAAPVIDGRKPRGAGRGQRGPA